MDLRSEILKEHSKSHALFVSGYIGNDKNRFNELIDLFLNDAYRVTQRAAWIVSMCADQYPQLIVPHLEKLIYNLRKPVPVAVKRNTVRILQKVEIPEKLIGETADICFGFLESKEEPVAVKVFSMTILHHIISKIPELKNELKILIEDQMPYGSQGFRSRGRKILKALEKV